MSQISVAVSRKAVLAARDAVMDILNAGRGDDVTVSALDSFRHAVEIKNVTIHDCQFYTNPTPTPYTGGGFDDEGEPRD